MAELRVVMVRAEPMAEATGLVATAAATEVVVAVRAEAVVRTVAGMEAALAVDTLVVEETVEEMVPAEMAAPPEVE